MQSSQVYCARIVRRSRSNFSASFRCLDRDQRRAMRALYAFCRLIDDIVDSAKYGAEETQREVARWRAHVGALGGEFPPTHPLLRELTWAVRQFGLAPHYLQDLVDGCTRDIVPVPIATEQDLLDYCYGVAGTVGLLCLAIFRVEEDGQTRRAALILAQAFQLTNIIRDLHEDLAIGRIYLPLSDWSQCGLDPTKPDLLHNPTYQDAWRQLLQMEIRRAESWYQQAWEDFPRTAFPKLRAAQIMSSYYHAILHRIAADPLQVLHSKVRLPWWRKATLVAQGWCG